MTLKRYSLIEFFKVFFVSFFVFSLILLLDRIFEFTDLILNKKVPLYYINLLFFFLLPNLCSLTIPMASLMASILVFGKLAYNNEINALEISGINKINIITPVIVCLIIFTSILIPVNNTLVPKSFLEFRKVYKEISQRQPIFVITPKTFIKIKEFTIYTQKVYRNKNMLKNIFVLKIVENELPLKIFANTAYVSYQSDVVSFQLNDGIMYQSDLKDPKNVGISKFEKYNFDIKLEEFFDSSTGKRFREMDIKELKEEFKKYKKMKLNTSVIETEMNLRYAVSFATLSLSLFGIPLGLSTKKGSKTIAFGLSILVIFVYYLTLIGGTTLGESNIVKPVISVWFGNVIFLVIGIIWIFKISK